MNEEILITIARETANPEYLSLREALSLIDQGDDIRDWLGIKWKELKMRYEKGQLVKANTVTKALNKELYNRISLYMNQYTGQVYNKLRYINEHHHEIDRVFTSTELWIGSLLEDYFINARGYF